jgi:hypothetical protein
MIQYGGKIEILRSGPHVEKYQFQVTIQVLEIYDEQVRGLFSNANPPGGPKIRMNPTTGVEVVDLTESEWPVESYRVYRKIDERIETANKIIRIVTI